MKLPKRAAVVICENDLDRSAFKAREAFCAYLEAARTGTRGLYRRAKADWEARHKAVAAMAERLARLRQECGE